MATSNTGDSHAFAIVEFLDTKEVEIVAFSWTFVDAKNGCMCYWPPYRNANKLKKLCVEQAPPDATWQTYKIRVLYRAGRCSLLLHYQLA